MTQLCDRFSTGTMKGTNNKIKTKIKNRFRIQGSRLFILKLWLYIKRSTFYLDEPKLSCRVNLKERTYKLVLTSLRRSSSPIRAVAESAGFTA